MECRVATPRLLLSALCPGDGCVGMRGRNVESGRSVGAKRRGRLRSSQRRPERRKHTQPDWRSKIELNSGFAAGGGRPEGGEEIG